MQLLIHECLIVALVNLLIARDKPMACTGIYAALWVALHLPFALGSVEDLVGALLGFASVLLAGAAFFSALSRLEGGFEWWIVVLVGNLLVYAAGEIGQSLPATLLSLGAA